MMSAAPRCCPGDLAVVVRAVNSTNIGAIVRVVGPHDGSGPLAMPKAGFVWLVEGNRTMTWSKNGVLFHRKSGPVPDSALQPLRGARLEESARQAKNKIRRAPGVKELHA